MELRNIFVISCSKMCMHNSIWEDNALLLITEFFANDENVDQRQIQNTEQNDSWSDGFSY